MKSRTILSLPRLVMAITACLFLASCTHTYKVKVDSLSKPEAADAVSYTIRNPEQQEIDKTLRRKEAEACVKTALSSKGMYEAPDASSADMVVDIDYGIEPPRVRYEIVSSPVYANVGGDRKVVKQYERVKLPGGQEVVVERDVVEEEPMSTELIGYREIATSVVIYEKYLQIIARENKPAAEGKPPESIWSIHVSAEDDSKDLRKYLPVMASAGIDYIGKNSESEKTVTLRDDDQVVTLVKKGM